MNPVAKIELVDWKFWAGFLCLLILGAGLRLFDLTAGAINSLEVVSALAWLIGGFFVYALSHHISSTMGALICLAYYYLLPLGIIVEKTDKTRGLIVFWLTLAIYGLYWLIKKHNLYWIIWAIVCLITLILEFYLVEPLPFSSLGERMREMMKLFLSPVFYVRWFEQLHGNLDLLLVLISAAAIFLLSNSIRNFLLSIWLVYGITLLTFPAQAMNNDYFHQLLIPIVAVSLGVFGDSFYREISKRGKVWQVLLFAVFVLAVLISTGYAGKRVLSAVDLSAILYPLILRIFDGIYLLWL